MRTAKEILKDIEEQKQRIELEERIKKDSGELSFLYYQLFELESELKEINNECSNKRV